VILRLQRRPSQAGATIGLLSVPGQHDCYTCEDVLREPATKPDTTRLSPLVARATLGSWVAAWKVPGVTAIPSGRYRVLVTDSLRFKKPLPLLVDVPGFAGVRIHAGNTAADTEGCVLVGETATAFGVGQSRVAFARVFAAIQSALGAGERVWIDIRNPEAP
jgi:hypothetical protein